MTEQINSASSCKFGLRPDFKVKTVTPPDKYSPTETHIAENLSGDTGLDTRPVASADVTICNSSNVQSYMRLYGQSNGQSDHVTNQWW